MVSLIKKPYPFPESWQVRLAISFLVSLGSLITLLSFKPFGLGDAPSLAVAGFSLNCLISMLIHFFILPLILPTIFKSDRWTIGKEVTWIISIVGLISILNFTYNELIVDGLTPRYTLWEFLYMTFLVGVLPTIVLIYSTEKMSARYNKDAAKIYNERSEDVKKLFRSEQSITLHGENNDEVLHTSVNNLLCISSEGNYVLIYHRVCDHTIKTMIRQSLKSIEGQLNNHYQFVRCHKSYIVNRALIEEAKGNARSLELEVQDLDFMVPVSRSFDRSKLIPSIGSL